MRGWWEPTGAPTKLCGPLQFVLVMGLQVRTGIYITGTPLILLPPPPRPPARWAAVTTTTPRRRRRRQRRRQRQTKHWVLSITMSLPWQCRRIECQPHPREAGPRHRGERVENARIEHCVDALSCGTRGLQRGGERERGGGEAANQKFIRGTAQ